MAKGWGRYRWLDFNLLLGRRIREGQTLVSVKYFTALMTHQPEKLKRQQHYLQAMEKHTGITPILGSFESRDVQCQRCREWYRRPQEKRTDVNIASHLLADAYEDLFDTAYLICADADLVPAVQMVQRRCRKIVVLIDPPRRHSDELAEVCDRHWHFTENHLRQSQLPDPVEYERKRKVHRLYKPEGW